MDIPLMIIVFALIVALIIAGLLVVLACGIRTADQRKSPCDRPLNTAEYLARSVLLYARRARRPKNAGTSSNSDRARSR
ncbi:hypothetical protein FXF51_42690 [Nonomuraea sp. PA05]|uniref:hypothetical protein n=1 Tax=Nonomuraea sp. PA05 TaxID=2604466 RepID=UPI0011D337BC|nr:hypothetical protein [Nonomuraea sp. PA05]TYB56817.1 hypothetical protein FXF51_42690 [Nonomuraea sp. PA05]